MQINYVTYIILFFFCNLSWGQFNTLNPPIKKEKGKYEVVELKKEVSKERKPSKSVFSKLFTSEKTALKREIDSLKQLIEKNTRDAEKRDAQKIDTKRIEDSIILSITRKIISEKVAKKTEREINKKHSFTMPISGDLHITSHFGKRFHPIFKKNEIHKGIDIRANYQFVYSVLDGVVSQVGWDNNGGGVFVKVKHSNGFETAYLHLSEVYYKKGEKVNAGFIIGRSGNTGHSTAPHLHFAVKSNEEYINPVSFLNDLITTTKGNKL